MRKARSFIPYLHNGTSLPQNASEPSRLRKFGEFSLVLGSMFAGIQVMDLFLKPKFDVPLNPEDILDE